MSLTTIDVFRQAAERGLRLKAIGNHLHVSPGRCCPPDFVPVLRAHKPHLISVLRLRFVMADSKRLGQPLFFCEDDDTRGALVQAGASEWSIYTEDELRILVAQNRAKPFLPAELCKVHEIKRTFHGRIGTGNGG
jgi:hypothetical protein